MAKLIEEIYTDYLDRRLTIAIEEDMELEEYPC
jgi:hypothetical protein